MSKAEKPVAAEAPKGNKKMLIIVAAVILLIAGGVAAFLLLKPAHAPATEASAEEAHTEVPPKYVELGTFTANLIHEEGDRYLQVAISLKLTKPELEEKIKASSPEILHRVNMLLQSKSPSELATLEGKENLASDIKAQVEYVIGFRKTPPAYGTTHTAVQNGGPPAVHSAEPPLVQGSGVAAIQGSGVAAVQSAEVPAVQDEGEHTAAAEKVGVENTKIARSGIAEVLFTSFIIQ